MNMKNLCIFTLSMLSSASLLFSSQAGYIPSSTYEYDDSFDSDESYDSDYSDESALADTQEDEVELTENTTDTQTEVAVVEEETTPVVTPSEAETAKVEEAPTAIETEVESASEIASTEVPAEESAPVASIEETTPAAAIEETSSQEEVACDNCEQSVVEEDFQAPAEEVSITDTVYSEDVSFTPSLPKNYYQGSFSKNSFLEFVKMYENKPASFNDASAVDSFFVWHILKQLNPKLVIECDGSLAQATWIIEQAVPNAEIAACLPEGKSNPAYMPTNRVAYVKADFSDLEIAPAVRESTVAYFSDVQNAYKRILQAQSKGIKYVVFSNNTPSEFNDEDAIPQLSLRDCYEARAYHKKAAVLKRMVKNYYILPQIVGQTLTFSEEKVVSDLPAIWSDVSDVHPELRDAIEVFHADAAKYRWFTVVELN